MREIAKTTICTLLGLAFVVIVGWWLQNISSYESGVGCDIGKDAQQNPTPTILPTQTEIQQILVNRGYDIGTDGVDGIIGPNSISAWNKCINDQYAKPYFQE